MQYCSSLPRQTEALENYPFLTPCVEIKKSSLYGVSTGSILGRFSSAAGINVMRFTNALREIPNRRSAYRIAIARIGEQKANMLRYCAWFCERARLR